MKKVLITGAGDLATRFLTLLLTNGYIGDLTLLCRDKNPRPQVNLALYAASEVLGEIPRVKTIYHDLDNTDEFVEFLEKDRPEVIINFSTKYPYKKIETLLDGHKRRLHSAGIGVLLPFHFVLANNICRAINMADLSVDFINVAYPDAINHLLPEMPKSRILGSGNIGNNIPAFRFSVAEMLGAQIDEVEVRLVMHHAVSHRIYKGEVENDAPFLFQALIGGDDVTSIVNMNELFSLLSTKYRRPSGGVGKNMAAAMTINVLKAILTQEEKTLHVAGPSSLIGGYPMKVSSEILEPVLPDNISI
ncbi:MAG: hypothetical protein GX640_14615, partial [Fibrobacter sp.]|nr:hypothetical protein [Fibrobacter sp.]